MTKFALAPFALLVACSHSAPIAPSSATGPVELSALAPAVSGTWAGTSTSTQKAHNGRLQVIFTPNGNAIDAAIVWTDGLTARQYLGTAHGTIDNLAVVASSPDRPCQYKAVGSITDSDHDRYTGSYVSVGASCGDAGTFIVRK